MSIPDVFIYQEGEEACVHYQRITPAAGLVRYGLTKMQKDFALNAGYTVYVVANGGTATGSAKSLAELKAAVIAEALDPDAVQSALLMDGKSAVTVLNDGTNTNKNIDVSLKRGVAKIRVNLSYGTDYQPTGQVTKKLVNYAYDSRMLESGDAYSPALATTASYTNTDAVSGDTGSNHLLFIRKRLEQRSSRRDIHLPERTDPKRSGYRKPLLQNSRKLPARVRWE